MRVEWDDNKNQINKKKHGISFSTAQLIFDDPLAKRKLLNKPIKFYELSSRSILGAT